MPVSDLATRPDHVYKPLKPQEIRVLSLQPLPTSSEEPLRGEIVHVPLHGPQCPAYEAVSYVWGYPVPSVLIIIDGKKHLLPKESERVLRRLALPGKPRVLWMDSVCINQCDYSERADQVSMMGSIYQNAEKVTIYIGDPDEKADRALADLEELEQEMNENFGSSEIFDDAISQYPKVPAKAPLRTNFDAMALCAFFDRPWFR